VQRQQQKIILKLVEELNKRSQTKIVAKNTLAFPLDAYGKLAGNRTNACSEEVS